MVMAMPLKPWTLDEVHRLPDDGNKYELVNGEFFVTPPPTDGHETILARLTALLSARPGATQSRRGAQRSGRVFRR